MDNILELKANWNEIKQSLKQKFGSFTESNQLFAEDKHNEMLGRLQIKLGRTRAEVHKIISEL